MAVISAVAPNTAIDVEDTAAVQTGFSHALLRPCSYLIEVM